MPIDMQKLALNKEAIIRSIQSNGPSLPVRIAREVNLSLLFASAYLSELYNEGKIRMSNMKVGSSPLYYLSGQEHLLENFIQHLNSKEKEAFSLLKASKLVDDEKMEPAIRVALRSIKDFAIPIRIKVDDDSRLFWKHFSITDDEIKDIAQKLIQERKKDKKKTSGEDEREKQETLVKKQEIEENIIPEKQIKMEKQKDEQLEQLKKRIDQISKALEDPKTKEEKKEKPIKQKKVKQIEESAFIKGLREYLESKEIELLETLSMAKKDFLGKVRIDTLFGKQEYLLIAKEKKKVTEEDLTLALHKAQLEKMPALFIAPGDIDKRSLDHAKTWRNLVKFEKVKF